MAETKEDFLAYVQQVKEMFHGAPAEKTCWDFEKDARLKAAEDKLELPQALLPDLMSPEEWASFKKAAAAFRRPAGLSPEKTGLFYAAAGLYSLHAAGQLTAGQAKVELRLAVEAYNKQLRRNYLFGGVGEFYRKIEEACVAWSKDKSQDNAQKMYDTVYKIVREYHAE